MDTIDTKRYAKVLRKHRSRRRLASFMMQPPPFFLGAGWHEFRANKPASNAEVLAFEQQWHIELPSAYKVLLTNVGNGVAGPYFGISTLKDWAQPHSADDLPGNFLSTSFNPSAIVDDGPAPGRYEDMQRWLRALLSLNHIRTTCGGNLA